MIAVDLGHDFDLDFQIQIWNLTYLNKMVWLPQNKKCTYWLNSRPQMWASGFTLAMILKARCKDLPDSDRGDFRCRRAVDSSSFLLCRPQVWKWSAVLVFTKSSVENNLEMIQGPEKLDDQNEVLFYFVFRSFLTKFPNITKTDSENIVHDVMHIKLQKMLQDTYHQSMIYVLWENIHKVILKQHKIYPMMWLTHHDHDDAYSILDKCTLSPLIELGSGKFDHR